MRNLRSTASGKQKIACLPGGMEIAFKFKACAQSHWKETVEKLIDHGEVLTVRYGSQYISGLSVCQRIRMQSHSSLRLLNISGTTFSQ